MLPTRRFIPALAVLGGGAIIVGAIAIGSPLMRSEVDPTPVAASGPASASSPRAAAPAPLVPSYAPAPTVDPLPPQPQPPGVTVVMEPAPPPAVAPVPVAEPPGVEPSPPPAPRAPEPAPVPPPAPAPAPQGSSGPAAEVVSLVNQERGRAGCGPLAVDDRLTDAAQDHAEDMAANGYFSHTSQDGREFDDRIRAAGHPSPAAENIAAGQRSAASVMESWMNSDGHRRNILDCGLASIGVGHTSSTNHWVQNFGR